MKKQITSSFNADMQSANREASQILYKCETAISAIDSMLTMIDTFERRGADWSEFASERRQIESALDVLVGLAQNIESNFDI